MASRKAAARRPFGDVGDVGQLVILALLSWDWDWLAGELYGGSVASVNAPGCGVCGAWVESRSMVLEPSDTRPLRVAQCVDTRWWNASAWYAVSLAEALAKCGEESYLIAPRGTPAAMEAARLGLRLPDVGNLASSSPATWIRAGREFRRFLREAGIDLVNVHSSPAHLRISLICRGEGAAVVRTRSDIRPPRGGPIQRLIYGRGTAHHLAAAEFMRRDYYRPLGIPPERISVLRGGVDTGLLDKVDRDESRMRIRGMLGLPHDALLVGMVARLSPVKGHQDVVNAMAQVCAAGTDAHLVLAGPDAQLVRGEIREWARIQGLESRLHTVGRVEDPLVWAAAFDVAVIASIDSEAICRSALEYLGLGIPLVATRVHAIPEVVVDGVGILVPPGQPGALARSISALLNSAGLRISFSEAGREHVRRNYSLERFGGEASAIFRRVCSGTQRVVLAGG